MTELIDESYNKAMSKMVEAKENEMATKYYSMAEVAAMLGISRPYVHYLKDTRKIKAVRIGAQWAISEKEVERFKRERNGDKDAD